MYKTYKWLRNIFAITILLLLALQPVTLLGQTPISDWNELADINQDLGGDYILTGDLDSSSPGYDELAGPNANDGKGFNPIGISGSGFTGTFDGNGYTISDLYIDRDDENHVGLFGIVNEGLIRNVGLKDVDIHGRQRVGALVGRNTGEVTNSYATGAVTGDRLVGGLVGFNDSGEVNNSYATGSVMGDRDNIGGLVGFNERGGKINNSYASGPVEGNINVGGLLGINANRNIGRSSRISNSYATGSVDGNRQVGGLIGEIDGGVNVSGEVRNSYAIGPVNGNTYVGGLVGRKRSPGSIIGAYWDIDTTGQTSSASGTGLTTAEMTGDNAADNMGEFDFEELWYLTPEYPVLNPFNGKGTEANPYKLETVLQVQYVGRNLSANFILVSDIDAGETAGWNDGKGFNPIGDSDNRFTGTFDGNGHSISDLFIDRDDENYVGLFGYADSNAQIENVGIEEVEIYGMNVVGGLAGFNRGVISNSYVTGSIQANSVAGGLIGDNTGDDAIVKESYATASVTIPDDEGMAGGLVGTNYLFGDISYSYATGAVTGGYLIGGLVGYNDTGAEIRNSYATGSVDGDFYFAGLVGYQFDARVSKSYATGVVTEGGGGLVDRSVGSWSMVTDSYWNTETSGQTSSIGGGTGLTTEEMRQSSSFNDWDFNDTWKIDTENTFSSFPVLQNNPQSPPPGLGPHSGAFTASSLQFLNSNDYVEIPQNSQIDFENPFTIEMWVKPEQMSTRHVLFSTRLTNPSGGFQLEAGSGNGGTARLSVTGLNTWMFDTQDNIITQDEWAHIAYVRTGNGEDDQALYINGIEVSSIQRTGYTISNNAHPYRLASRGSTAFPGHMDEIRVWETARTAEQIRDHMFQKLQGDEDGLAGYWPMNDGTGTQLTDLSPKANNGTLVNSTAWSGETHPYGTFINGNEGWRLMSPATGDLSIGEMFDGMWTQGFTGADVEGGSSNIYTWNESTQQYESVPSAGFVPPAGTGISAYIFENDEYEVPGSFPKLIQTPNFQHFGSQSPDLSYTNTDTPVEDGWNLVGNPYGTTIDWDASGWNRINLEGSFYLWNSDENTYQSWNGSAGTTPDDGLIAPWQGFWVQAHDDSPSLTFTDDIRSAGAVILNVNPVPQLSLTLTNGNRTSQTVLMLDEDAQEGKDSPKDTYKLQPMSTNDYLLLYTLLSDGTALDINALPANLDSELEVELGISGSDLNREFNLSWDPKHLPSDWEFHLIDRKTGESRSLTEADDFGFELSSEKTNSDDSKSPDSDLDEPLFGVMSPKVLKSESEEENRFIILISPGTNVNTDPGTELPDVVALDQNYPNPFNPTTQIAYDLPENAHVRIDVYNVMGQRVATLVNSEQNAGSHTLTFDGQALASGVYLYRLRTGSTVITRKMMLVK